MRISSLGELDSLGADMGPYLATKYANFDFTSNNLYILLFNFPGKEHETVKKANILVNESTQAMLLDFKASVPVGGSGMSNWSSLYYFTIPIAYAGCDFTGSIEMDEKSSLFQNDDHDFTRSYSLFN